MVKIRLRRMGARNSPYYRIVVSDSRQTARAEVLEELGSYDPLARNRQVKIDRDARHASGSAGAPRLADGARDSRASPPRSGQGLRASMRRLVETVVRRLSDHPDEARVIESSEGRRPSTTSPCPKPTGAA